MIYAKESNGIVRQFAAGNQSDTLDFISEQESARKFIKQETGIDVVGAILYRVK